MVKIGILLILLVYSVYSDCRYGKIYNAAAAAGLLAGLLFRALSHGLPGVIEGSVCCITAAVIVYPLFKIGALGGGDLKLLAMTCVFLRINQAVSFVIYCFVFGAVSALLKMLKEHNLIERFRYLLSYVYDVYSTNRWKLYGESDPMEGSEVHKIRFSIPILLSLLLQIGGVY